MIFGWGGEKIPQIVELTAEGIRRNPIAKMFTNMDNTILMPGGLENLYGVKIVKIIILEVNETTHF
jgi:hypothetical protein